MLIICVVVLILPQMFAATTFPALIATSLSDVTIKSRNRIMMTGTALTSLNSTKQISADITSILSASGSKNFPKSVIWLFFRASFPSKWSVIEATINTQSASKNLTGIASTSKKKTISGTSNILNIVSLLGVFNVFPAFSLVIAKMGGRAGRALCVRRGGDEIATVYSSTFHRRMHGPHFC